MAVYSWHSVRTMLDKRRPFCGPCAPGLPSPFGGPGSGLWPSGGATAPAQQAAGVTPTPGPSCVTPSIFADCFGACTGVINGASPGPICGWTYIEPFGALGGEFNFAPGVMSMDSFDADDFPNATKPLSASLATVLGLSGQFEFTEYLTPPNPTTTYSIVLNNFDLSESLLVGLFGDGDLSVQAGDPASIPFYLGAWTPVPGASHVVHFAVDGAGIPTIFIDGVAIPLVFTANVPSFSVFYPVNSISYGGGAGDVAAASSPLRNLFVTAGDPGPATVFCCP